MTTPSEVTATPAPISIEEPKGEKFIPDEETILENGAIVNPSGHAQELVRRYGAFGVCALSIVIGDCWAVFGGTVRISLYNGGPMGIMYEFLLSGLFYIVIALSLAELASAVPTSGGVYHWASITPGRKWGRPLGFFAGYWNLLAWTFGAVSLVVTVAEAILSVAGLTHPGFVGTRAEVFVTSLVLFWICTATIMFGNKHLTKLFFVMVFVILGGWLATILVVAIAPSTHKTGYASEDFVWKSFLNDTGYKSNGLAFVLGMLNGAFAMSTADGCTHMSEETRHPSVNIPKAMMVQMSVGYLTNFVYMIIIFYGINDIDEVFAADTNFPLTVIYQQATNSIAGTAVLTLIVALALLGGVVGSQLSAARTFWALARDHASPLPSFFGKVNRRWETPLNAVLFIGGVGTVIICIFMASEAAYTAFVSSFVVFLTFSYLACLLPFLISGRRSLVPGPFFIKGPLGYVVHIISCTYLTVMVVFYCFPYELPVDAINMNYSALMFGGFTIMIAFSWLFCHKSYKGPSVVV